MNKFRKEIGVSTKNGLVRICSFCTPNEIQSYTFDGQFRTHAQFKSLYTHRKSLEKNAAKKDANVVLALTARNNIIGFGVLAYPDKNERWSLLQPELMFEVRVIEVCRDWRRQKLCTKILEMMLDHPLIEEKIAYMIGYCWTWDLEKSTLTAMEYKRILIHIFESFNFKVYETNEPNICMKSENLFMCRLGKKITDDLIDRFNWLRFGIKPESSSIP